MLESMGNTESQTYYPFDYAWTYDKLGMMPHAYNLSYSGGKDQEDQVSRPAQAKS
jgi:hypothetical protein